MDSTNEDEGYEIEEPSIEPLIDNEPSPAQIQSLLQAWLDGKAKVLSGGISFNLPVVAREPLLKRVLAERDKDDAQGQTQMIDATITSLEIVEQTLKRIEVKALITYNDQRISNSGETISITSIPSLGVTYILGREKNLWQLVAYRSGG